MFTLKNVLMANAISCIIFGLIFICLPIKVAVFLGGDTHFPELILQILGVVLVINGLHLIWASLQQTPNKWLILYFSFGDFLWAISSSFLLLMRLWITTMAGIITTILVALMVTVFGIMQIIKSREMCNFHD
ncbi:hypothetical protein [Pseudocolwellia sp. HL-MZ7]|uniref:hypothetical protein n=1 Tax=Pseudocolwellia sp. HL-MZ7 TaxID=3400627 RepID=UPI003CFB44EC